MGLNFEGSLNNISDRQLAYIREVIEKRGYKNAKVTIDPVGVAGDNYVANVKRVTVSDENGIFKMIAKLAPQSEVMRLTTQTEKMFKNEHHIYTEILPKFQELEAKTDVPDEYRLKFAACYGSLTEPPHEVILLEDLQESNFIMVDRFKSMPNECVKATLKNFAILHSLSFALKNKEPHTYKTMKSNLFDMWAAVGTIPESVAHFSNQEKNIELMLEDKECKRVLKGAITQAMALAVKLSKLEVDSKHSVIQQGDSWTNNIMFRFDGDNLQQSIMIDYQIAKESNPTRDIHYMIFNCTDHKTRLEHFHDWIDYYHSELDKCLSNFGLKASYVYPRDQLDADMKRYAKLMFGLSLILAMVLSMQSGDAAKLKEAMETLSLDDISQALSVSDFNQSHVAMIKARIQGLVDSYMEFGLL